MLTQLNLENNIQLFLSCSTGHTEQPQYNRRALHKTMSTRRGDHWETPWKLAAPVKQALSLSLFYRGETEAPINNCSSHSTWNRQVWGSNPDNETPEHILLEHCLIPWPHHMPFFLTSSLPLTAQNIANEIFPFA